MNAASARRPSRARAPRSGGMPSGAPHSTSACVTSRLERSRHRIISACETQLRIRQADSKGREVQLRAVLESAPPCRRRSGRRTGLRASGSRPGRRRARAACTVAAWAATTTLSRSGASPAPAALSAQAASPPPQGARTRAAGVTGETSRGRSLAACAPPGGRPPGGGPAAAEQVPIENWPVGAAKR